MPHSSACPTSYLWLSSLNPNCSLLSIQDLSSLSHRSDILPCFLFHLPSAFQPRVTADALLALCVCVCLRLNNVCEGVASVSLSPLNARPVPWQCFPYMHMCKRAQTHITQSTASAAAKRPWWACTSSLPPPGTLSSQSSHRGRFSTEEGERNTWCCSICNS